MNAVMSKGSLPVPRRRPAPVDQSRTHFSGASLPDAVAPATPTPIHGELVVASTPGGNYNIPIPPVSNKTCVKRERFVEGRGDRRAQRGSTAAKEASASASGSGTLAASVAAPPASTRYREAREALGLSAGDRGQLPVKRQAQQARPTAVASLVSPSMAFSENLRYRTQSLQAPICFKQMRWQPAGSKLTCFC